ncbi:MAG: hypothetical protein SFT81_02970 [Candidatus Caenarcaniphilales bacterium]|nr:hypothetical protein [Candidatus Caenarcaniphilales bacterium]
MVKSPALATYQTIALPGGAAVSQVGLLPPVASGVPSNFWGGGYNLNSLNGGGWGGFPAGYGLYYPPSIPGFLAPYACHSSGCCGVQPGSLITGFGGYYSPFIPGF